MEKTNEWMGKVIHSRKSSCSCLQFYTKRENKGCGSLNIHEYQGKEILELNGVAVPKGKVAFTVEEAVRAAETLNSDVWVVKAQIHAGGRGKAGGVKVAKSLDEVQTYASDILGSTLVTHQTGLRRKSCKTIIN